MIEAVEIITRNKDGATKPFFCLGSDGNHYFVKGLNATYRGMIAEMVTYQLALALEIPIPEATVMHVDEYLIESDSSLIHELGAGPVFASRKLPFAVDARYENVISGAPLIPRRIALLDKWVRNNDRQGSSLGVRSNMLVCTQTNGLYAIDHNLAFDPDWSEDEWRDGHIASKLVDGCEFDIAEAAWLRDTVERVCNNLGDVYDAVP